MTIDSNCIGVSGNQINKKMKKVILTIVVILNLTVAFSQGIYAPSDDCNPCNRKLEKIDSLKKEIVKTKEIYSKKMKFFGLTEELIAFNRIEINFEMWSNSWCKIPNEYSFYFRNITNPSEKKILLLYFKIKRLEIEIGQYNQIFCSNDYTLEEEFELMKKQIELRKKERSR